MQNLPKTISREKAKKQECLLVKGARQIGKTYIIDYFGKTNYQSYIYINFIIHIGSADYLFLAEFGTIKKGNNSVLRRRGVC